MAEELKRMTYITSWKTCNIIQTQKEIIEELEYFKKLPEYESNQVQCIREDKYKDKQWYLYTLTVNFSQPVNIKFDD